MDAHEPMRFLSTPPATAIHYPKAPFSRGHRPLAVHSKGTFPKRVKGHGEKRKVEYRVAA